MNDGLESKVPPRIVDAEGVMGETPLVYALVHALDRAITGEMVFGSPTGETHRVTFFEGAPVRVEPRGEGERVGEDLIAMDHLREEALVDALVDAGASRRRLGELLVQAGAVEPDVLTQALRLQTARRLALLANLPPTTTFSLYFSARAEPEPHAPWAPLDMLLATLRAWGDRSRLHGTLRWLASKPLHLCIETNLEALMLTSRERAAVELMRSDAPSLKTLYATVGNGLSSLLYMLAVTRQFTFSSSKGEPMGRRKVQDPVRDVVQVAVPIAPLIVPSPEAPDDLLGAQASLTADQARIGSVPPEPPPAPAPPVASPKDAGPVRPPARPSSSMPKVTDPGRPPARLTGAPSPVGVASMSDEFRRAEEAVKHHDYETADRILRERCPEEDTVEPDFQALSAWVKANLAKNDLATPLNDLTFLLMAHSGCESALYYRGQLLKRSGKEKAALRDFVILAKKNPNHAGALAEIKILRENSKKP